MTEPIRLFVSSSPELAPEREALGQNVAELPVSVGWEIKHTPRPGEGVDEALDFLARSDLFLLVLGADFAAPTTPSKGAILMARLWGWSGVGP